MLKSSNLKKVKKHFHVDFMTNKSIFLEVVFSDSVTTIVGTIWRDILVENSAGIEFS